MRNTKTPAAHSGTKANLVGAGIAGLGVTSAKLNQIGHPAPCRLDVPREGEATRDRVPPSISKRRGGQQ